MWITCAICFYYFRAEQKSNTYLNLDYIYSSILLNVYSQESRTMWWYLKKTNSPSKKAPPSTAGLSSSKSDSNPHQAQPQAQPVPETPSSSSSSSEVEPKKERQFKMAWKVNRPWLKYEEGLMFCSVCWDHVQHRTFIDGTPPTKIDRIKLHETSKYHLNALEKSKKKPAAARESVAGKT